MCTSFETGVCKFGTSCNFAHGLADLRSPPRGGAGGGGPPQPPQRPMNGWGVGELRTKVRGEFLNLQELSFIPNFLKTQNFLGF